MPLGTSTPWAVDHGHITPHIVKAVQGIAGISSTFKANLTQWSGSAENGIVDLFAKNIYATDITVDHGHFGDLTASSTITGKELCAQKSGGTPVCVTR